jgi:hypothetical protein
MLTKDTTEVYCIKSYHEHFKCEFTKGLTYKVLVFKPKNKTYIRIYGDSNTTLTFGIESIMNVYDISTYFLTTQEIRKMKLEKLNLL